LLWGLKCQLTILRDIPRIHKTESHSTASKIAILLLLSHETFKNEKNDIIPKTFVSLLAATAVVDRQGYKIFCIKLQHVKNVFTSNCNTHIKQTDVLLLKTANTDTSGA
jgi:hypothetical protein